MVRDASSFGETAPPDSSSPFTAAIERRDAFEETASIHDMLVTALAEPPRHREAVIVGPAGVLASAVEVGESIACKWVLTAAGRSLVEREVRSGMRVAS